ncbi:transposase [Chloroflexota bacterium]
MRRLPPFPLLATHLLAGYSTNIGSAQVIQIVKSISAQEVFRRFPKQRKQLWVGELWNDGYFVRSVGGKVTTDIIRKYI